MSLRDTLKNATQPYHQHLEKGSRMNSILDRTIDLGKYCEIIKIYQNLYSVLEPRLLAFEQSQINGLNYRYQHKLEALNHDLKQLNTSPAPILTTSEWSLVPEIKSLGAYIGVVYVLEGSTLGAQKLAQLLQQNLAIGLDNGGRFFYGYGPKTITHWQQFVQWLDSLSLTSDEEADAIANAQQSFLLFASYLQTS